jgi:hypothetical protein
MGEMPVSMRPPVTRPPHFDVLMNSIRGLTRKVDHIKVFSLLRVSNLNWEVVFPTICI